MWGKTPNEYLTLDWGRRQKNTQIKGRRAAKGDNNQQTQLGRKTHTKSPCPFLLKKKVPKL